MGRWVLPWDQTGGTAPAGKPSRLVGDRPSSGSSDLDTSKRRRGHCATSQLTKAAPDIAIGRINLQDGAQVLNGVRELVARAQYTGDALHGRDGPLVVLQGLFIALHGAVKILHLLGQGA